MPFEPINIFSRRIDPRGVAELLRRSGYEIQVEGPDDDWKNIVLAIRKGSLFRKPRLLTFAHDAAYYDGDDWPRQVMGMQGYFSRFPEAPRKADILRLIGMFRFALSVPQDDLDIESGDDRLALLHAVCRHLDGVIFTPSALRDAQGRILLSADGQTDPSAVMPQIPLDESKAPNDDTNDENVENDFDPVPPTPQRVARRALALTAVAARATLELDAPKLDNPEAHRSRLLEWLGSLDIDSELEPEEWKVLQRPAGAIERQDHVNAMWRVEGLAVLAWALQLHELPPDDELIVPAELYESMGLFNAQKAREILHSPNLRSADELTTMRTHLLMLHWRLRDFSIRPWAMDFVSFSKSCWIGSFDATAYRLANNDLAIGNVAIADAEDDALRKVSSLALERHLAINWLAGDSPIYSQTDTST